MNESSHDPSPAPEQEYSGSSSFYFEIIRGLVGMSIGGVLGIFAFGWAITQGFYAIILPGVLAGLGCRILTPRRLLVYSIICACVSLIFGLYAEWSYFPFSKDNSLTYFVTHIHQLKPITLILIALGAFFGFWTADRR